MRHAQAWTIAVIREMVTKENLAETRETARQWRELYPLDPGRAAREFATALAEDFPEVYGRPCNKLWAAFMKAGFRRVNWRRVAEFLLDRFAPLPGQVAIVFRAPRTPSLN